MGIQPSLLTVNVAYVSEQMRQHLAAHSGSCNALKDNPFLDDLSCFELCYGGYSPCCKACSPRPEVPLSFSGPPTPLADQHELPKSLYLWAAMHHSDPYSWIRAVGSTHEFWRDWARLTQRTVHVTADTDLRGMCGFLTNTELPTFIEGLKAVQPPPKMAEEKGLDTHEMNLHIEAFEEIIECANHCIGSQKGLAWVHDFVI